MSSAVQNKCFLKSVNKTHPHIEISANDFVFVGRLPVYELADDKISRKQLKMKADFNRTRIDFELVGVNASILNGVEMEHKREYTAQHGDIIEILPQKYPYRVHFDIVDELKKDENTDDGIPAKSTATNRAKKRVIEAMDEPNAPFNGESSKRRKLHIDLVGDLVRDLVVPFTDSDRWQSYNDGQLIVYTSADCQAAKKIAAYDMDGTLITTKSGRTFPLDSADWKIAFGNAKNTLKAKHSDNYKIVVFTNQAGLAKRIILADLRKKFEKIIEEFSVPMQVFIATYDNPFRKPMPMMWWALCDHLNDNVRIDESNSYYVGDAAGRPENKSLKKKKDHSTADRFFALNINLTFFTPEEHFLKTPTQKWQRPEFEPLNTVEMAPDNAIEPSTSRITSDAIEMIIMVGIAGSGKSSFCRDHLATAGYEIINCDTIGTMVKCISMARDGLKSCKKVVIDNTNVSSDERLRFIKVAKENKVKCRCLIMNTSFKHAEHNNAVRAILNPDRRKVSKEVMNTQTKYYTKPRLSEGFDEIVTVNFIPKFANENEKMMYMMYLID